MHVINAQSTLAHLLNNINMLICCQRTKDRLLNLHGTKISHVSIIGKFLFNENNTQTVIYYAEIIFVFFY